MEKIRVMIIGKSDSMIFEIKSLLQSDSLAYLGFTKQDELAMDKIRSLKPGIVLMHYDGEDDETLRLSEKIYVGVPGCAVILLNTTDDASIAEKAMPAGVRMVLQMPVEAECLREKIESVYATEKTRLLNTGAVSSTMQSRVVAVFGAKGGIGKTTITANFAVLLAMMGKKVAVIDADLQFGDVNVFFDVDSKDTIAELSQSRESSDIDAIRRIMVMHHTGVSILCAPKSPEYAEYVSSKNIEAVIATLRPYYDYILVDTTPLFTDVTMAVIESANLLMMVTGMDISTLKNTKTSLGILESLQQSDKVEIVINRITSGIITIKDIQRILEIQVKNRISYDYKTAVNCHNKGIPIVLDAPRTTIAKEMKQLAANMIKTIDVMV